MHYYIALALVALGAILVFSKDTILDKDTQTPQLKMVYEHATYVGIGCIVVAYFIYSKYIPAKSVGPRSVSSPSASYAPSSSQSLSQ